MTTPSGAGRVPERGFAAARDERQRAEAHDYARLLVTDVRLYNEEAVYQGRAARDLRARLAGPIAVARGRFDRRFTERAAACDRQALDQVFEEALVRILAGGDTARLR